MEYSTDNTNWYEFGTLRDTRVPTSDSVAQWTPSSGVDHYALVDEYPAINDADYNYSVTYNAADSFGFTAFAIPAGATISNVNLRIRAKRNTQNRDLLFGLKIHGDHWWTGVGISATSFTEYIATWITNPHSEQAWTVDDVNGVGTNGIQEFAYLCGYAVNGDALYVSSAYLEVCYVISPIIWDYDDGLATEGVPTTTYLLTGTDAHKAYFESDSYPETFTVGNLAELDFTIKPTGNIGNLKTYYFRILGDGVALDLVAGKTHPQILTGTAADRRALPLFLP